MLAWCESEIHMARAVGARVVGCISKAKACLRGSSWLSLGGTASPG